MNLRKVTNEEVEAQKRQIEELEVHTQALVSTRFPFESLLIEFESANHVFIEKLQVHEPAKQLILISVVALDSSF